MRVKCNDCLRDATHEYQGRHLCWNCEPREDEDEDDAAMKRYAAGVLAEDRAFN